ncbi:MAG: PEP-CTERM sorting domain-containing protein [Phycisphaerales bacterium]|nr:PEP-CTERM sorting domain-containing protein [Planctomycetota bacterium]MCH8508099.1 PEP-CTERM sorting domain-containing protein [Phycisphaerales bacterium]
MKALSSKMVAAAAVGGLGLAALPATANNFDPDLDIVVNLGQFTLFPDAAGDPIVVKFNVTGPGDVVGISFGGDASGVGGTGTWASDSRLSVVIDGTERFNIGGLVGRDNDWDFQGSQSTNDGNYTSGPHLFAKNNPVAAGAAWTFAFSHDWFSASAAPISWSGVTITLHRVPAPGAMALLGLGGLVAGRRRR